MGANNGKFYDVANASKLFLDNEIAYKLYSTYAALHEQSLLKCAVSNAWRGLEADTGKSLLNNTETSVLAEILSLQEEVKTVQSQIAEKFALLVDSGVDARIEYDVLEIINNYFKNLFIQYDEKSVEALNRATADMGKFGKYGTITLPDFSGAKTYYIELCGGDEVAGGYLYECMDKLVQFDNEALAIIQQAGLIKKVDDIRMVLERSINLVNEYDALTLKLSDFHIWNMPGFLVDSSLSEMGAEAFVSILKDLFIDLPGDGFRYLKDLFTGKNDFVEDLKSLSMKKVASWFEEKSDLFGLLKIWSKDNHTMRDILAAFDFKTNEDGTYTVDVHTYNLPIIGECCWQQVGGYTDLYDIIFDTATDMARDKFVVEVPGKDGGEGEIYTFWFWKGDYLNLGYGGEVGFYEGDGNTSPFVKVDPDHELHMTMQIDYNGDGIVDEYAKAYDDRDTWWITNFNPYAKEKYFEDGEEFSADEMTITYTIDLTNDMDIYEAWKSDIELYDYDNNKDKFTFEDGYVMYRFEGNGKPIQ